MSRTDVSGPIGCHETSMNTYKSTLRNTTEDRGSRLHCGGSLKSCKLYVNVFKNCANYPLSARLYRWCKKKGHRLSRVQIEVLQGHAASVICAEKWFFSVKTTPTTASSKLWHSPTKLHDVITEDRSLKNYIRCREKLMYYYQLKGARGGAVGWGTAR
jgi:hypothetical protein